MATSSDDYLPVGERPEWADMAPRALPATPQPVVAIGRDELLGDLMDYLWAAVEAGELSERVLSLTEEIIRDLNSSNYTVWEWRWRCIEALGGVAARGEQEKALTRSVATANPKNYQLWNHRRRLALALGPGQAEEEMAFSAACLQHDAKNYHAWAHRQAVLLALAGGGTTAGYGGSSTGDAASSAAQQVQAQALWAAELAFTERLLREDLRNNSAWNQRIFVLRNAPPSAIGPPAEAYDREVDFAARQLRQAPHNESCWEALRALAAGPGAPRLALAADPRYLQLCREVLGGAEDGDGGGLPACAPALSLLADVLLEQAALLQDAAVLVRSGSDSGGDGQDCGAAAGPTGDAAAATAAAAGPQTLDPATLEAAVAAARRLAAQALERQLAADPIKRPYLTLELAAVEAALRGVAAQGAGAAGA
ncbi:hypothetical protein ABPG75_009068 [Micractinium tetrahymenae]